MPTSTRSRTPLTLDLLLVFLIGVLLRVQYVAGTPPEARSYDLRGHMEYIGYVFRNFRIPSDTLGWETHQPPLYYFFSGLIVKTDVALGRFAFVWKDLQMLSLLFSVLTLATCLWMTLRLFPKKSGQIPGLVFLGCLATLPGIVFVASRISNDTLTTLVLFVFFALLLQWWTDGSRWSWRLCSAVAGIGILTKVTAYLAFPVLLFCLWQRRRMQPAEKARLACEAIGIGLLLGGWFLALRLSQPYFPRLLDVGWGLNLSPRLLLPMRPGDAFSFSITRMLEIPFSNPWSDVYGRRFFWEYLFKSAFFGEWQYPKLVWLCRGILTGGFGVLALAAMGLMKDIRQKDRMLVPLLSLLAAGLLMVLLGRLVHFSVANQDFRLMPVIAVPVAAFACHGIASLRGGWRTAAVAWMTGFFILCASFIFTLSA